MRTVLPLKEDWASVLSRPRTASTMRAVARATDRLSMRSSSGRDPRAGALARSRRVGASIARRTFAGPGALVYASCAPRPAEGETTMARLTLSFASAFNERVQPLMDASIQPEGMELVPTYSHPSETFWRQLKFGEFDIAEMSLSSYLIARSRGTADMIAIPVFPSRLLFQTWLAGAEGSAIRDPGDLAGKRIGVPEYQMTAALWMRGILDHDFGVSQYKVDWHMERTEELSHGGATGFTPPPGISFHRIPPDKSMAAMLIEGELEAALL